MMEGVTLNRFTALSDAITSNNFGGLIEAVHIPSGKTYWISAMSPRVFVSSVVDHLECLGYLAFSGSAPERTAAITAEGRDALDERGARS